MNGRRPTPRSRGEEPAAPKSASTPTRTGQRPKNENPRGTHTATRPQNLSRSRDTSLERRSRPIRRLARQDHAQRGGEELVQALAPVPGHRAVERAASRGASSTTSFPSAPAARTRPTTCSGRRPRNRRRRTAGRGRSAPPSRKGEMRDPSPGLLAVFGATMQPYQRSRRPNAGLTRFQF